MCLVLLASFSGLCSVTLWFTLTEGDLALQLLLTQTKKYKTRRLGNTICNHFSWISLCWSLSHTKYNNLYTLCGVVWLITVKHQNRNSDVKVLQLLLEVLLFLLSPCCIHVFGDLRVTPGMMKSWVVPLLVDKRSSVPTNLLSLCLREAVLLLRCFLGLFVHLQEFLCRIYRCNVLLDQPAAQNVHYTLTIFHSICWVMLWVWFTSKHVHCNRNGGINT